MTPAIVIVDPLRRSRRGASRGEIEFACRALANDEHNDHAIAATLEVDVDFVRHAIAAPNRPLAAGGGA